MVKLWLWSPHFHVTTYNDNEVLNFNTTVSC